MYGIIVAFPFADPAFMAGFQAGIWWRDMCSGKQIIEGDIDAALKDNVKAMAKEKGYTCIFKKSVLGKGSTFAKMINVEHHDPDDVKEYVINRVEQLDGANDE